MVDIFHSCLIYCASHIKMGRVAQRGVVVELDGACPVASQPPDAGSNPAPSASF